MRDAMNIAGRIVKRADRLRMVRVGLAKRKARLVKSMAISPQPRAGDLARWASIRAEIAEFEAVLAELEAGRDPPPSPLTGARVRELPDYIGGAEDRPRSGQSSPSAQAPSARERE